MMNKKGQAFLIIALVVVGIIIGLSATYTQTKSSKEETKIFDLSDEIYYEGAQVVNHGTFNNQGQSTAANVETLLSNYSKLNPDSEIILLYGDSKSISEGIIYTCQEEISSGVGSAQISTCTPVQLSISEAQGTITTTGTNVQLVFPGGEVYNFELEQTNQNFFVVLKKQTTGGEKIVVQ